MQMVMRLGDKGHATRYAVGKGAEANVLVDPGHVVGVEVDLARAGIDGARDEGDCSDMMILYDMYCRSGKSPGREPCFSLLVHFVEVSGSCVFVFAVFGVW